MKPILVFVAAVLSTQNTHAIPVSGADLLRTLIPILKSNEGTVGIRKKDENCKMEMMQTEENHPVEAIWMVSTKTQKAYASILVDTRSKGQYVANSEFPEKVETFTLENPTTHEIQFIEIDTNHDHPQGDRHDDDSYKIYFGTITDGVVQNRNLCFFRKLNSFR